MGFTPDARLLVAAKRRMSRIGVIAVCPYASGLNAAAHFIGQITVTTPDARPQAILRVVGELQRLVHGFKRGDGQHRSKNFLLENAHVVLTEQDSRLKVVALLQIAAQHLTTTAGQHIGPLFFADINIVEDGFQLAMRYLRSHLGDVIQRITAANRLHAPDRPLHKALINGFLHQRAARTGADFTLVEREQRKPFQRFVEEGVLFIHHVGKEDVRRFPAQLQGDRNDVLGRVLHDLLTHFR